MITALSLKTKTLTAREGIARFPRKGQRAASLEEMQEAIIQGATRKFTSPTFTRVRKRLLKDSIPYFPKKADRIVPLEEIQTAIEKGGEEW
ncbi:MAG: hypothetical protein K2W99_00970 [Chthoniobacterales bacterium]|nr:hypothetical protein [Chthoniobacterales bacterium]